MSNADDTTNTPEIPAAIVLDVVPVAPVRHRAEEPPTLDAAFMLLCRTMVLLFDEQDDLPSLVQTEEIMGWYSNGPSNYALAWQHAVLLLEKAIQVPLRGGN